jgi:ubiquinone/menaquinone biosynthesis C-methylase UbiE
MRHNYNILSRWYGWITWSEASLVRMGLDLLAAQRSETILEIGPGSGQSLVDLARSTGPHPNLYGLDIAERMLRTAARRLDRASLRQKVDLIAGNGCQLPFASQSFDAIFMSFTLELFSAGDIQKVLAECRRVLSPGGRLCVVSLLEPDRPSGMVKLYNRLHHLYPHVIDCRPIPLRDTLARSGFAISAERQRSLWGIPITCVLGIHPQNRTV